jgi:hypothetical protein
VIDHQVRKSLDNAIADYEQNTLPKTPVIESQFVEKGTFGEDGWSIRRSLKLEQTDD